jgi:hypothetical protein
MPRQIPIDQLDAFKARIAAALHAGAREGLRNAAHGSRGVVVGKTEELGVVDQGELRDSWKVFDVANGHELRATAEHAAYMEVGTSPAGASHGGTSGELPPWDEIWEWVERHFATTDDSQLFLLTQAIRESIFEEGLEPRRVRAGAWPGVVTVSERAILTAAREAFRKACGAAP